MNDTASLHAPPTGWATLRLLNRYHWFVFVVAALGWLADCMDQQLFNLGRVSAVRELLISERGLQEAVVTNSLSDEQKKELDAGVKRWASWSTSIFLLGWATGGIVFGILGDRWGRVRTMILTILLYSLFTGLSAFSVGVLDFAFYRFLTGLGVGGEFAVGVALLAETMPAPARPFTLGMLQAFSAFGNITAALLFMGAGQLQQQGFFDNWTIGGFPVTPWRALFLVGTLPALLAIVVRRRLQEPEQWRQQVESGSVKQAGSYREMLGEQPWRTHALAGLALAFSGVVGLWAISFFSVDLQQYVFDASLKKQGLQGKDLEGAKTFYAGVTSLMLQLGAFLGMFAFSTITPYLGRRGTFVVFFLAAAGSTALVFLQLNTLSDILWMVPLMGFCQLALFGGYAIYFPELFPTRLRSTGTSFCYNVGRFIAAAGPPVLAFLANDVFITFRTAEAPEAHFRYAGLAMCSVYVIGLMALVFLPETKGKPLPE
jgi:MFS family permease